MTRHHRKAARAEMADQFVHERIFGAAQRGEVDPRGVKEFLRIDRAGMRGIEDDRRPPVRGLHDLERWRQVAISLGHSPGAVPVVRDSSVRLISARKSQCFVTAILSVIAGRLPSEKSPFTLERFFGAP